MVLTTPPLPPFYIPRSPTETPLLFVDGTRYQEVSEELSFIGERGEFNTYFTRGFLFDLDPRTSGSTDDGLFIR